MIEEKILKVNGEEKEEVVFEEKVEKELRMKLKKKVVIDML